MVLYVKKPFAVISCTVLVKKAFTVCQSLFMMVPKFEKAHGHSEIRTDPKTHFHSSLLKYSKDKKILHILSLFHANCQTYISPTFCYVFSSFAAEWKFAHPWDMPTLQKIKSLLMTKQMISSSKLVALNSWWIMAWLLLLKLKSHFKYILLFQTQFCHKIVWKANMVIHFKPKYYCLLSKEFITWCQHFFTHWW